MVIDGGVRLWVPRRIPLLAGLLVAGFCVTIYGYFVGWYFVRNRYGHVAVPLLCLLLPMQVRQIYRWFANPVVSLEGMVLRVFDGARWWRFLPAEVHNVAIERHRWRTWVIVDARSGSRVEAEVRVDDLALLGQVQREFARFSANSL